MREPAPDPFRRQAVRLLIVCGILLLVGAAPVSAMGVGGSRSIIAYHAPVFSRDGGAVYFVRRSTEGTFLGPGVEHFTPPSRVHVERDEVALCRLDLEDGELKVLEFWPQTPVTDRRFKAYRGSLFAILRARLMLPAAGGVDYTFDMTLHQVPRAEYHRLEGIWGGSGVDPAGWQQRGHSGLTVEADLMVRDTRELLTLPGNSLYPSALVLYDHQRGEARVLLKGSDFEEHFPEGLSAKQVLPYSRYERVVHLRQMKAARQRLEAGYLAQGMSEGEAAMATIDGMRRLGYYPQPDRLTAREVSGHGEELPVFDIADAEMKSGIFPDIERALGSPGEAVEKSMGRYVIHRDYTNSARLNSYLDDGGERFYVRFRSRLYLVTLKRGGR